MYKLCKTEQSARRQRQLELGLQKMLLTRRYEDISVSDLCEYLQVPRKSFYRYFSSKDGCLYALLDHTMMEFFGSVGGIDKRIPDTKLGDLDRYFAFWRERGELLDALQRNGLGGTLVNRAMDLTMRERLMPIYLLGEEPEVQRLAMAFSVCGLLSMVIQWHSEGFRQPPEEMTQIAVSILTHPLIQ